MAKKNTLSNFNHDNCSTVDAGLSKHVSIRFQQRCLKISALISISNRECGYAPGENPFPRSALENGATMGIAAKA